MKRHLVTAAAFAVATATILSLGSTFLAKPLIAQQQSACLHGTSEAPAQVARRQQALGVARAINTAQSAYYSRAREYGRLQNLNVPTPVPPGFAAAVTANPDSYAFSVKDTLDPCRFAYFSDETGLIFRAEVIR